MIAVIWQFDVKKGREEEFEKLYGADGDWTALNRRTRSYIGTSFLRDQSGSARYLLIEYWSEMLVCAGRNRDPACGTGGRDGAAWHLLGTRCAGSMGPNLVAAAVTRQQPFARIMQGRRPT